MSRDIGPRARLDPGSAERRLAILRRFRILDRLRRRANAPIVYGNRVDLFDDGRDAFGAMIEAVAAASRGVGIEMYTWADDGVGRRFAEVVRAKASQGVAVSVLVDSFGSLTSGGLMASLEQAGVEVRWYHPLAPWTPAWYPNLRDHRKLVIADGEVGFAGGMNLAESYSSEFLGERFWRDLVVRIEGPAVREMVRLFVGSWIRTGGSPEVAAALEAPVRERGAAGVQVVGGAGLRGRRSLRRDYLGLIGSARSRIFLANAYFAPEGVLRRALVHAARRGVSVELLVPGETDVPMVRWAGRASYGRLLSAGVRIREMKHAVLHAKVAVFDGEVLLAGSANLDHRSFRHNLEVAINVLDRAAAAGARSAFAPALEDSDPIDPAAWKRRPAAARLLERMASALSYWL